MQASDYLKMKFQSDRQLAVYSQQGVTSTWKAMQGSEQIYILAWSVRAGIHHVLFPYIMTYANSYYPKKKNAAFHSFYLSI
ncbi:hypothetical protein QNH14_21000 [Apirhabdus apintestini]|nr:hypothetical protein QNH14_21000 [Enterobacteriaceae bacterium CA-0114]